MNKIARRKSPRPSKRKVNPFENRGMDKFSEVYSELEKLRASIAAQEGVSTSDVWFRRGSSQGRDWIPVVVGKSRSSSASQEDLYSLSRHNSSLAAAESKIEEELVVLSRESGEEESQNLGDCSKTGWFSVRLEQVVHELQHGTRKALKAITLFIMIVAAVVDVLIAVIAGVTSCFIARHLRPLWARFLPATFSQQHEQNPTFGFPVSLCSLGPSLSSSSVACVSAPSSPRQSTELISDRSFGSSELHSRTTSASTPVSPLRSCSTFFNSDKPQEAGSPVQKHQPRNQTERRGASPIHRHQQSDQQQVGSPSHRQRSHPGRLQQQQQHQLDELESSYSGGAAEVMLIIVVILFGLIGTGLLAATVFASMAWFVFPLVRRVRSFKPSIKTTTTTTTTTTQMVETRKSF